MIEAGFLRRCYRTAGHARMAQLTICPVTLRPILVGYPRRGCQKAITRQIRMQRADYVLRVRANHQSLHDRLEDMFALERAGDFAGCTHDDADTVGKDHGRPATKFKQTVWNGKRQPRAGLLTLHLHLLDVHHNALGGRKICQLPVWVAIASYSGISCRSWNGTSLIQVPHATLWI